MPEKPNFTDDELVVLNAAMHFADSESKPYVVDDPHFGPAHEKLDQYLIELDKTRIPTMIVWRIFYKTEEFDSAGDIHYEFWAECKSVEQLADSFRSLVMRMLPIDIQVKKIEVPV